MGVRLSEDEAWAFIESSHTATFTSLRKDGSPVALPVWFVAKDRIIYIRTPAVTKKVARVRNDSRGSFLVESGLKWAELKAVHVPVTATLVEDAALATEMSDATDEKYKDFATPVSELPDKTREYYQASSTVIRLEPAGKLLTWDNARLGIE